MRRNDLDHYDFLADSFSWGFVGKDTIPSFSSYLPGKRYEDVRMLFRACLGEGGKPTTALKIDDMREGLRKLVTIDTSESIGDYRARLSELEKRRTRVQNQRMRATRYERVKVLN